MSEDFAALVREHQDMVFRTLTRMVGRTDAVPDLAQEVFLRLHRALPHFEQRARLTTYLYRIVINVAQDEWKRRQCPDRRAVSLSDPAAGWEDRLPHQGPSIESVIAADQLRHSIDASLSALPAAERSALVLFHQEGRSYEAIAAILDVPINTVRTHLHRGRRRLAGILRAQVANHDL